MFGSLPIIAKIVLRVLPSTGLVALRVGGAAVAFLFLRTVVGRVRVARKADYARLALYSLLGVILNQLLFIKGLSLTTAINATLLGTSIPAFALVISIALGYDRVSLRKLVGIALAAAGVIYLIDPVRADFSGRTTLGNLLIVLNCASYGAYIAVSKDLLERYGPLTVITWIFIFGSIVTIPIGGLAMEATPLRGVSTGVWLAVVYIIIAPTVVAYYLNAWALVRVAPSTVAVYIYLQPMVAFSLSPLILDEGWNARAVVAGVLIFGGVALVTRRDGAHGGRTHDGTAGQPDAPRH